MFTKAQWISLEFQWIPFRNQWICFPNQDSLLKSIDFPAYNPWNIHSQVLGALRSKRILKRSDSEASRNGHLEGNRLISKEYPLKFDGNPLKFDGNPLKFNRNPLKSNRNPIRR